MQQLRQQLEVFTVPRPVFIASAPDAQMPAKPNYLSTGFDLFALASGDDLVFRPQETARIETGIMVFPPEGQAATVSEKSSLALKGMSVAGGVIDADYSGTVKVILRNNNPYEMKLKRNLPVAQLKFEPCMFRYNPTHIGIAAHARGVGRIYTRNNCSTMNVDIASYSKLYPLTEGGRGDRGFGSSSRLYQNLPYDAGIMNRTAEIWQPSRTIRLEVQFESANTMPSSQ